MTDEEFREFVNVMTRHEVEQLRAENEQLKERVEQSEVQLAGVLTAAGGCSRRDVLREHESRPVLQRGGRGGRTQGYRSRDPQTVEQGWSQREPVDKFAWGWSEAYQKTHDLRAEVEALRAENAQLKDEVIRLLDEGGRFLSHKHALEEENAQLREAVRKLADIVVQWKELPAYEDDWRTMMRRSDEVLANPLVETCMEAKP